MDSHFVKMYMPGSNIANFTDSNRDMTHDSTKLVDKEILAGLETIGDLPREGIEELASKIRIEKLPAGRKLFVAGTSDKWSFFLLDGILELTTPDGRTFNLPHTAQKARQPIVPQQPRRVTATAKTMVQFIRIDNDLLAILRNISPTAIEVGEINAEGDTENRLFHQFYQDYMDNRMALPSLPDIAIRVGKAIRDPDNSLNEITRIVQSDAALTARLIQVANSPMYRGQTDITSCRMAISRLGMESTRNLTFSFAMKQLFKTRSSILKNELVKLWRHSSRVAAICHVLARLSKRFDPDFALLAGLVHDIGALPVIIHAENYPDLKATPARLEAVISRLRPQVGAMVLRKWKFPEEVIATALDAENWMRDPAPSADLCDLVIIAQIHSFFGMPASGKLPVITEIPAFAKLLGGKLTPEASMAVLQESQGEIDEMMELLGSP